MCKTNAMRLLAGAGIAYEVLTYEVDENDLSGVHIAEQIGLPLEMVFKTLVARGDRTGPLVFCIPVAEEIDLRAAASLTGNKKIEMVHVKDLLGLTGYIRGGCSPVGMKKKFPTYFDSSVARQTRMTVSAGVRGAQLLLDRAALVEYVEGTLVPLIKT
ncbi:MAG: Cys-tRNA(Pro) deacylase [Clostridia bacterium]|nr:Cys-tRNA(Pro) deacylase [Clostridia bacterium]MBQ1982354.1 Cys-tRNA(Pro) deacylase [Clostridia bacterium]